MDKKVFLAKIGKSIRERREQLGYAQDKFAINNDIDRGYYWKIEHGRINLSLWKLHLLARNLDTTVAKIVQRAEEVE